jgi:hypothetical protein
VNALHLSVTAKGTVRLPESGLTILLPRQESRDVRPTSGRLTDDTLGGDWRTIRIVA